MSTDRTERQIESLQERARWAESQINEGKVRFEQMVSDMERLHVDMEKMGERFHSDMETMGQRVDRLSEALRGLEGIPGQLAKLAESYEEQKRQTPVGSVRVSTLREGAKVVAQIVGVLAVLAGWQASQPDDTERLLRALETLQGVDAAEVVEESEP